MTESRIKVGISSCLLGEHVRYDGGHKHDHYLTDTLGKYIDWVSVCPEVECGLPVPREAMRLVGDPKTPRLVTRSTGIDHTDRMLKWASEKVTELEKENLCGFVFKSKSPSSGYKGVKVFAESGLPVRKGIGLFANAYINYFPIIPVEDDRRLQDPKIRENFIERIIVFSRWMEFESKGKSAKGLIAFHADHELLLMSHSQKHYILLGRMVAGTKGLLNVEDYNHYIMLLLEGLRLAATVRKSTNVLHHLARQLKKHLAAGDRKELAEVIEKYHKGSVPLIVPITLINQYLREVDDPYLKRQHYLAPDPLR